MGLVVPQDAAIVLVISLPAVAISRADFTSADLQQRSNPLLFRNQATKAVAGHNWLISYFVKFLQLVCR